MYVSWYLCPAYALPSHSAGFEPTRQHGSRTGNESEPRFSLHIVALLLKQALVLRWACRGGGCREWEQVGGKVEGGQRSGSGGTREIPSTNVSLYCMPPRLM